ncbi:MAG: NUDIX domain-containing protein [Verrucomicrobiota bacterium]
MKKNANGYQVGVFPVTEDGRVVLVSRRRGHGWIFPKGNREKGKSDRSVAREEAYEEAGIFGAVTAEFEEFRVAMKKSPKLRLFRMKVKRFTNAFPEADERRRVVVSFEEAERMVRQDLRVILRKMQELKWAA